MGLDQGLTFDLGLLPALLGSIRQRRTPIPLLAVKMQGKSLIRAEQTLAALVNQPVESIAYASIPLLGRTAELQGNEQRSGSGIVGELDRSRLVQGLDMASPAILKLSLAISG